jgi:hypothetical protein
LTYYGIDFDPDDVTVEMDPFLMGRAVLATNMATKEYIDGFHTRIIKGDLQKEVDDAKVKLNAAVVAHSIMDCYTQTPNLRLKLEPAKARKVLYESHREDDFWKYCNGFLKDFGLGVKEWYPTGPVDLELELLSEWTEGCIQIQYDVL